MWSAVQQLHRLFYFKVTFLEDCLKLMNKLQVRDTNDQDQRTGSPELINIVQDIKVIAATNNYAFAHIPRTLVDVVDKLAKEAKLYDKSYVVSWLNY